MKLRRYRHWKLSSSGFRATESLEIGDWPREDVTGVARTRLATESNQEQDMRGRRPVFGFCVTGKGGLWRLSCNQLLEITQPLAQYLSDSFFSQRRATMEETPSSDLIYCRQSHRLWILRKESLVSPQADSLPSMNVSEATYLPIPIRLERE